MDNNVLKYNKRLLFRAYWNKLGKPEIDEYMNERFSNSSIVETLDPTIKLYTDMNLDISASQCIPNECDSSKTYWKFPDINVVDPILLDFFEVYYKNGNMFIYLNEMEKMYVWFSFVSFENLKDPLNSKMYVFGYDGDLDITCYILLNCINVLYKCKINQYYVENFTTNSTYKEMVKLLIKMKILDKAMIVKTINPLNKVVQKDESINTSYELIPLNNKAFFNKQVKALIDLKEINNV